MSVNPNNPIYYKVLNADGSCYHGGQGKWFLPGKNKPGKWMPKIKGIIYISPFSFFASYGERVF